MTQYTSGTQARDGRTVNHDPNPWVGNFSGARLPDVSSVRYSAEVTGDWTYAPRPEYAVLDNPILAKFRRVQEFHQDSPLLVWEHRLPPIESATPDQTSHARRVLTRLANLAAD